MKTKFMLSVAVFLCTLTGCFGRGEIKTTCDEPKPYQSARLGKPVEVPDDLDPLDEMKEMPIPKAESEPPPPGGPCIETPPSVVTE